MIGCFPGDEFLSSDYKKRARGSELKLLQAGTPDHIYITFECPSRAMDNSDNTVIEGSTDSQSLSLVNLRRWIVAL
jgi:hypothetical protein